MVRELFRLAQKAQQEYAIEAEKRQGRRGLRKAKLGYSQQWYFFAVAAFWMYLRYAIAQQGRPTHDTLLRLFPSICNS